MLKYWTRAAMIVGLALFPATESARAASYPAYIPPDTELFYNDYTTSPSGVYYAVFVSQTIFPSTPSYEFWIVPGSNPSVAPCCLGYNPLTILSDTSLGGFFAHMQPDGNFVVYTSATGTDQGTVIPVAATNSQQSAGGPYFAQVGDDGSFTIYSGSDPVNFNNGPVYTAQNNSHGAVTSINLLDIDYDFSKANILSMTGVGWYNTDFVNPTDIPDQVVAQQNISYTQTATLTFSVADAIGESISGNVTFGVPGIVKDSLGFSITNTTTITHGKADSDSSTVTFIAGSRPVLPPHTTYNVQITGTEATYTIPYSWSGVATYEDGTTANVVGDGIFKGASQGNFLVTTTCVLAVLPQTCEPGSTTVPALISPVDEPGAATILSMALVGFMAARRFFTSRARSRFA
ncbi:MAG: hypothetical protein AB7H90_20145 [Alphaproteobacteria bacterium]